MDINIHSHNKEVPTVDITDQLLKTDDGDRIVTYVSIQCGKEKLVITAFADDAAEVTDNRKNMIPDEAA